MKLPFSSSFDVAYIREGSPELPCGVEDYWPQGPLVSVKWAGLIRGAVQSLPSYQKGGEKDGSHASQCQ